MPWPSEPTESATLEVEEFTPENGNVSYPFTTYTNNIYVCPINLKYDGQKAFTKVSQGLDNNVIFPVHYTPSRQLLAVT